VDGLTIPGVLSQQPPEIEVSVFTPEKAEALTQAIEAQRRRSSPVWEQPFPRRGRVGSVVCGVVIAALHVLIVAPLLPGAGRPHPVSHAMGSVSGADAEPAIQVSLIEEPPLRMVPPPPTTALTMQIPELPQLEPSPDLLQSLLDKVPTHPTTDAAGSSALAGRYLGQIDARIERAWLRPRTPLKSGVFHCEVQVEQDETGRVLQVEMQRCDAEPRWQQTLASAIQSASPLPAPPDPSVFRKSLHLSFTAKAYSEQGSEQGYAPLMANDLGFP